MVGIPRSAEVHYRDDPKIEVMWQVYLLLCADQTLYCGSTNNLDKRLAKHNNKNGAKYTRGRLPVILVKTWDCANKSQALKLEAKIKKMPKDRKLSFVG
jgi:putative endonuclease